MKKHDVKLPFDWKFRFNWDMSLADKLLKMGWTIKDHEIKQEDKKSVS